MDINGDGYQDIITGQYWPGDIFVFFGQGDGKFSEMDNLKDESGRNLNAGAPWEDEDDPRMESLAAAPYATDFDGDGDYDMLIGNIEGAVVLIENIGGVREPVFSVKREKLSADGEPISVPSGDAGPVFEDWNHDGIRDLVVGAGDGSVWYYENISRGTTPRFAAGEMLVPESTRDPYPHGSKPKTSGVRCKVCVTDYNGDGLVDLLLGDFMYEKAPKLELSDEQKQHRDELHAKRDQLRDQLRQLRSTDESADRQQSKEEVMEEFSKVWEELRQFDPRDIYHGFVWLYKRKASGEPSIATTTARARPNRETED